MNSDQVSIVIPVFNAFDEVLECLQSVLRHTSSDVSLQILDDASTEGDFGEWIAKQSFSIPANWTVSRNDQNLGFTATVNLGMKRAKEHDVVLLNSDTLVTDRWLEKLSEAAYSDEMIGTVTPFTNDATICGVPRFCQENEIPAGSNLDEFARLIEEVSQSEYPTLPTCVGFCVYIKRSVLNAVGLFDEQRFPRGYGEENDFSCRLQAAGYRDVLDDRTYVFHRGGSSFRSEKEELMQKGLAVLKRLHPHYLSRVQHFVRSNPLRLVQWRIQRELLQGGEGVPRVLHVLHNGPYISRGDPLGGTEFTVQSLIESDSEIEHWSLVRARNEYILEVHHPAFSKSWYQSVEPGKLQEIITPENFPLLHVHHTRWFPFGELVDALHAHGNYIVSLHDFVSVCPRFHLFTVKGEHCSGAECTEECGYSAEFISEYREHGERLLAGASKVLSFSKNTVEYIGRIQGKPLVTETIQHGVHLPQERGGEQSVKEQSVREDTLDPLRVVIGAPRGKHKGRAVIEELITHQQLPSGRRIEWHIIGESTGLRLPKHVVQHGAYLHEELPVVLEGAAPDVGISISLCPETYCLAVDEFLAAGIPMLVGPLGAPAERIVEWGVGWIADELTSESLLSALESVLDPVEYRRKQDALAACPVRSISDAVQETVSHYAAHELPSHLPLAELLGYLEREFSTVPTQSSRVASILGKCLRSVMYLAESMRLHTLLQQMAYSLLPGPFLERLKRLRASIS